MSVELSVGAPVFGSDPGVLREAASFYDSSGISGIYAFDHLIPLGRPAGPVFDLASTVGVLAAASSRVSVGTMVMRVGLRSDDESVALGMSLDAIAGRRAVVGLGIGDHATADEQERFCHGVDPATVRRRRMASIASELRAAGVSVAIGGLHPATLEIAAESGSWNGWGIDPGAFAEKSRFVRSMNHGARCSWGSAVMLGTDAADLEERLSKRSPGPGVMRLTMAEAVALALRLADGGADEIILTPVPNRRPSWELVAGIGEELA